MTFRDKLYYVALTEYLINKNNRIDIDKNTTIFVEAKRGIYNYQPGCEVPSIDFNVSIMHNGENVYTAWYQKIYEDLSSLRASNPEKIKEFINMKDSYGNLYIPYPCPLYRVNMPNLSIRNPKKLIRQNVSNYYNELSKN